MASYPVSGERTVLNSSGRQISSMIGTDFVEVKAAPVSRIPRAAVKTKKSKKKQKQGKLSRSNRRPLSNISAASVSLQDAADFAGAAWKWGKYALALINSEEKKLYVALADAVLNTAQTYYVSAIGQGTDYYQRLGNSIKVTNVRIDFLLTVNTTAVNNIIRVIIFRDLMNTGGTLAASDLLQDTATSTTLTITSPYKIFNGDRFEVMYDEVFHMSVGSDDAVLHKRLGLAVDDHILYQGTSNVIGSAWQGALFIMVLQNDAVNKPFMTMSALIDFVDD